MSRACIPFRIPTCEVEYRTNQPLPFLCAEYLCQLCQVDELLVPRCTHEIHESYFLKVILVECRALWASGSEPADLERVYSTSESQPVGIKWNHRCSKQV